MLDTIKSLAFKYATQAGITISKNDIVIPPEKAAILAGYEAKVKVVEGNYERGLITEDGAARADRQHLDGGDRRRSPTRCRRT